MHATEWTDDRFARNGRHNSRCNGPIDILLEVFERDPLRVAEKRSWVGSNVSIGNECRELLT